MVLARALTLVLTTGLITIFILVISVIGYAGSRSVISNVFYTKRLKTRLLLQVVLHVVLVFARAFINTNRVKHRVLPS